MVTTAVFTPTAISTRMMPSPSAIPSHAGAVQDVATDDDDGADLADCAPKTRQYRGQQAYPAVPQQRGDLLPGAGAHGTQVLVVLFMQIEHGLPGQRSDDGKHQHALRDDHGRRRE